MANSEESSSFSVMPLRLAQDPRAKYNQKDKKMTMKQSPNASVKGVMMFLERARIPARVIKPSLEESAAIIITNTEIKRINFQIA